MGLKEKTQFTIVFIPHHGGRQLSLRVPRWAIIGLAGFSGFLLLGLGFVTTGYINKFIDASLLKKLQVENRILRDKLGEFSAKSSKLQEQIDNFVSFDSKIRMMAGLPAIDPDIRRVGIGGNPTVRLPREVSEGSAQSIQQVQEELDRLNREARLQNESFEELSRELASRQEMWDHLPSIQPAPGWIISDFGYRRDPFTGEMRMHEGIDIAGPSGTSIVAPSKGTVKSVGYRGNYGLCLEIDHGYGVVTRYAHCSLIKVAQGARVSRGQVVALMGATGRATGPHLHYEVLNKGQVVDPEKYIILSRMF